MARQPRLIVPNELHYVSQQGNNAQQVFLDDEDYQHYLNWLREGALRFKVTIHAYALLPTQVRLLVTPSDAQGLARIMQWTGRYYVPYFNQKYGRSGTLWEGRYRTSVVQASGYLLSCSHYVELAPVREGLVQHIGQYPWTSYAHHVGARHDPVVHSHALYWGLGNTPFDREMAYLHFSSQSLSARDLAQMDAVLQKGWVLGAQEYKALLQERSGRRVGPGQRGRPRKAA